MKWFFVFVVFIISCNNKSQDTTKNEKDSSENLSRSAEEEKFNEDFQILPGEKIGRISLGMEATNIDSLLGTPTSSNAAMGKAWLTWKGKRDEHNNETELNVFTNYRDNEMEEKTVQMIRTTSSSFKTKEGFHVYNALEQLMQAFPGALKISEYKLEDGRYISLYDVNKKGIAFEIVKAGNQSICIGIIIYENGKNMLDIFRTFQPDIQG